ncbi:alpha/beta fold hydrolase [Streptomyces sp. NPDC059349]|uniref:alpha/beta fold hydrolase n=1 Tax=Streptomyces sp. NPDC059349 TaxID=3346808 RepID=UPI0036C5D3FC
MSTRPAALRPDPAVPPPQVELRRVEANGVELNVALAGHGPALLLLHGFPHTWQVWSEVLAPLAAHHLVIAPDMRGFGASERAALGYDANTLAEDARALLGSLGLSSAAVVALDAGVPPALSLALRHPQLVDRLVLMESLAGTLPGAEDFLTDGPPWWFGFHAVPGLAESALEGNEERYVDFFLDAGTLGEGVPAAVRDAFIAAYTGHDALRCAFSYYRTLPLSAQQIQQAVTQARLTMPTMTIGAHPVGRALEQQLRPVADDLTGYALDDCGHIVPLHRPAALLRLLQPFLAARPCSERLAAPST